MFFSACLRVWVSGLFRTENGSSVAYRLNIFIGRVLSPLAAYKHREASCIGSIIIKYLQAVIAGGGLIGGVNGWAAVSIALVLAPGQED
jgi:hypothetical protein